MSVADGDGQRVGGVIGLRHGPQVQQTAGHFHHLLLFRFAVAHHRRFDLQRGVAEHRHPLLLRRQQQHPAGFRHGDGGGAVGGEKELLHRHGVGAVLLQQHPHIVVQLAQACLQRQLGRGGDGAVLHQRKPNVIVIHQAHAHNGIAGIDAHDAHGRRLLSPSLQGKPAHNDTDYIVAQAPPPHNKNPRFFKEYSQNPPCRFVGNARKKGLTARRGYGKIIKHPKMDD